MPAAVRITSRRRSWSRGWQNSAPGASRLPTFSGSSSASAVDAVSSSCWSELMRRAKTEEENNRMVRQQREFRMAADVVTKCWLRFSEVQAVAVIGSVAKPLWKQVPRFSEFRRQRIEIWHECGDLDLALWIDSQHRLGELRRARDLALRDAFESGVGISVANHRSEE